MAAVERPAAADGMAGQGRGIAYILASGAIFAFTDALSKVLAGAYPPGQILCFRSVFVLIAIAVMVRLRGGLASVRVRNWRGQVWRGLMVAGTSLVFIVALKHAPLADLTALLFVSPLILTALAPYFLGERVGWRRRAAVAVGFCGVLLIVRPSGDVPLFALLLGLLVPVLLSASDLLTRHLARTDTANAMMLFSNAVMAAVGVALLPLGWETPDWEGLAIFAAAGTLQGVAQYLLIYAFMHGETVVIAPFRYVMLVWASLYGYLIFGTIPRTETFFGAAIVIAAGLYIFHREARHGRA
ncbi:MAG: DMT family transporter [Alphaproteobacteria bacterium]|nr:DMT family transporter [Alphaproteobacteria bacterium]MCB9929106.1 DMT family transporter [Alphaproteobacteria bacterium]